MGELGRYRPRFQYAQLAARIPRTRARAPHSRRSPGKLNTTAVLGYSINLLAIFIIYGILTLGLNMQFGYAGIPNFTYITFIAVGAYITGVTGLPPSSSLGLHYILGLNWPFPLTLNAGTAASALLAYLLGLVVFRRIRGHYLAIVTFGIGAERRGLPAPARPQRQGDRRPY
jgi:ABC-type branched-subunit amino acid transport system permease subunit